MNNSGRKLGETGLIETGGATRTIQWLLGQVLHWSQPLSNEGPYLQRMITTKLSGPTSLSLAETESRPAEGWGMLLFYHCQSRPPRWCHGSVDQLEWPVSGWGWGPANNRLICVLKIALCTCNCSFCILWYFVYSWVISKIKIWMWLVLIKD